MQELGRLHTHVSEDKMRIEIYMDGNHYEYFNNQEEGLDWMQVLDIIGGWIKNEM